MPLPLRSRLGIHSEIRSEAPHCVFVVPSLRRQKLAEVIHVFGASRWLNISAEGLYGRDKQRCVRQGGDMVKVSRIDPPMVGNAGQPTSIPKEKRTGSNPSFPSRKHRCKSKRREGEPKKAIPDEPKTRIDDEALRRIKKAKMLWGIISHPAYAHDDDGLGALTAETALYYAIQGRVFADEAFVSRNFRISKTLSRNVRRGRITSGKSQKDSHLWRNTRTHTGSI